MDEATCSSEDGLPPGWQALHHKTLQRPFFFHESSRTACWAKPYIVDTEESPEVGGVASLLDSTHTVLEESPRNNKRGKKAADPLSGLETNLNQGSNSS